MKISFSWRQLFLKSVTVSRTTTHAHYEQARKFILVLIPVLGSKAMTRVVVAYLKLMVSIPIRSTDHWRAASFSFDTGDFWNPPTLWNKPGKVLKSACHHWFAELEYRNKFQMLSGITNDIAQSFPFFPPHLAPNFFVTMACATWSSSLERYRWSKLN